MRILHAVELYAPSVGGAQEVVRQVSERLVAHGHEVTVATSRLPGRGSGRIGGVELAEFDVSGNDVRGIEGDVDAYRRFVTGGDFDLVMTYAAQQWTTDALLPLLESIGPPTVLAPCGFSGLHDPAYGPYFERLSERLHAFDELIFHSTAYRDVAFARDAGVQHGTLIPNGADEREFAGERPRGSFRAAHGLPPDAPLLLSVGAHTGLKGHPEAMAVLRGASSCAGGALAIVGNLPTGGGCLTACRVRAAATRLAGRGRRVLLPDPPRPHVLDAYADADLFVFCSRIECSPIVLFEAMAAGLPFVSADVGNAAEIAAWSGGGVIVPSTRRPDGLAEADVAAMAEVVDELMADDERRREMGERGRRAWRERFTWEAVAARYGEVYEGLVA